MKRFRVVILAFSAIIVLLLMVLGIGVFLAQSNWLRERIRTAIISEAETATGGKVELGRFQFDWQTLTAQIDHFVIHGKEAAGQNPLLVIDKVTLQLKIISLIRRQFDLAGIAVEHPQVHLIEYASGGTNIPEPKVKRTSKKPIPETILDLKIGKFDLHNGDLLLETPGNKRHETPFETRAQNLAAHVAYEAQSPRYIAEFSASPLHFENPQTPPLDLKVQASATFERNRLTISKASVATKRSSVEIANGSVEDFANPVLTADLSTRASVAEVCEILRLRKVVSGTGLLAGKVRCTADAGCQFQGKVHAEEVDVRTNSFLLRDGRVDSNVAAHIDLKKQYIELEGIRAAALGGTVNANGFIRDFDTFDFKGQTKGLTLRRGAATFTKYALPYDATINDEFDVSGRFNHIDGVMLAAKGALDPIPNSAPVTGFVNVTYNGDADQFAFTDSTVNLPHSRVDFSGALDRHLDVKVMTTKLDDTLPFFDRKSLPVALKNGSASFQGSVDGPLRSPVIAGHGEAHNAVYDGQLVDALSADINVKSTGLALRNARITAVTLSAQGDANVALNDWAVTDKSAIDGHARINQTSLTRLFDIARQKDVPLTGNVSGTGTFSGTVGNPRITADLKATQGAFSGEPFDTITAHVESPNLTTQTATGEIIAGQKHAEIKAQFDHSAAALLPGNLTFQVQSNRIALNQVATLKREYPDLNATATLKAEGAVAITQDAKAAPTPLMHYRFSKLDGNLSISGLELAGRTLGNTEITAVTRNEVMTARIFSDIAQSGLHGEATIHLNGDYPIQSRIAVDKLDLNTAYKLANPQTSAQSFHFAGTAEGTVTLNGPLAKREQLTGSLEIPHLELRPLPTTGALPTIQTLVLRNSGTLRASLARNILHFDDVRFEAPSTSLAVTGSIDFEKNAPLDMRAQGNVNLQILEGFSPDLTASGVLNLNASLRGAFANPDLSGRAELKDGDFHVVDFANGLTNANGAFLFNGSRATIQSLAAESGGGKVTATGFLALTKGLLAFNLETKMRQVRVRYPEGVSTVADADLTVAGTSERSQASGQVRIRRLTINPRSGAGGVIAKSVEPVRTPSSSNGLLSNLNLDVQIETSPDVAFQTSLAQTLQAEASLRLRGTATNPALLGRVTVTEGEVVFFGNKYTVTQGTISFFNPAKIEPILNVDLETKARGVQVIITVSGPLDKPLNVTYRSDPPLQFSDIVALLATGRSPTDPSIALRDTSGNQSLQQLGASALLGQAIANPVSGRLQRFFGVSKLKIDPQLSGITGSPQARLTIEQQITPDILFTYITDVSSTSTQLIRVEWSLNKTWSAIVTREENGYVGLDFAYKKRFK